MNIMRLGDVCEVVAGQSPAGSSYNTNNIGIEFHQGKKLFFGDDLNISSTYTSEPTKLAKAGDILLSVRAPVGPTVLLNRDICIGRGLAAIRTIEKVDAHYVYYFLKHIEKSIEGSQGAVFPSINRSQIEALEIPVPPIEDQLIIVEKLKKSFRHIDESRSENSKILKLLLQLEESAINKVFNHSQESHIGLMSELTDVSTDYVANGSFASLSENVKYSDKEDFAILLRLIDHSRGFKGPFVYVDRHAYEFLAKSCLEPGDIIISNVGARLGTVFRAPDLGKKMTLGPNAILIKSKMHADYLYVWLRSSIGQRAIKELVGGAGQPKFNKTDFRKISIPVPNNPAVEKEIISEIKIIEERIEELTNLYSNKLAYLNQLKESILLNSFSGSAVK